MSIDNTVNELSNTLSELGRLVGHINSQIAGITGRINQTLDNFDGSVARVAGDASSVTGQITDTVSQVPNSWVFYLLLITLCIVFILLSVVLSLNLVTKAHAIYVIFKGRDVDKQPILDDLYDERRTPPGARPSFDEQQPGAVYKARQAHVALPIEYEPPRRFGVHNNSFDYPPRAQVVGGDTSFSDNQPPVAMQRRIDPNQIENGRQGVYHLDSGSAAYTTRSLRSQEV
ncbi:unnamed protein product, partial [Mesorhabditis spiculigera]